MVVLFKNKCSRVIFLSTRHWIWSRRVEVAVAASPEPTVGLGSSSCVALCPLKLVLFSGCSRSR